ncbi:MAG: DegT/DnrJ/EryC1/StrS family aminotransferase [Bacteroides sp.]|nr:DegT/DnrJ/EryC1/StrS family aminotransferase [Prevotella sp.]MCM1407237.1 DegT/DnrJ/EryC1/StrS family aminotransferase [Treponema brennaborense]MCM1469725.1 DegT/DnrJ/EryC1/StrS family aminotransferase [Bacteroides sp.]
MFVPFFRPSIGQEEENAVLQVMRSGWLTTAKETLAFEQEFSNYVHSPHALAVNSATSGLTLAMDALGITKGTKILTTPYTFISTAAPALHLGAGIVYADIEKDSYNIDAVQIEKKLRQDSAIKAIIPVHIAGNICNMDEILFLARKYNVHVIEDAAHAFPSKTAAGYAGTLGDCGVFSFYATKAITTAEGGMICTANNEIAARIAAMRLHGIDRSIWERYTSDKASWEYDVTQPGYKCNLPDILSAIGRVQLKKAESFFEKRKTIAMQYNEAFSEYDFLQCPPDGTGNAWHLYLLRIVPEKLSVTRTEFANILQNKGIGISMHFIPHFHMSYWKQHLKITAEDFPNAEKQYQRTFTLPLWPDMTQEMVRTVIEAVIETGKKHYAK